MKRRRPSGSRGTRTPRTLHVLRIGCVSFLNSKPLIEGLDGRDGLQVRFDVPSRLLADLEAGEVDAALCPVIDYQRSRVPLKIVPAGGIGCAGTTLTVRLYSRVPLAQITRVHADTDSHTSVALLRVLLAEMYGLRPRVVGYRAPQVPGAIANFQLPIANLRDRNTDHPRQSNAAAPSANWQSEIGNWQSSATRWPQAMLLIGDKVVTDSPPAVRYPHQLDLGHAWHELTGLPFVFAIWMARAETDLGDLPAVLRETRRCNARRIDALVARHAAAHGWPADLARQYLGHWLQYDIRRPQIQAMETFFAKAHRLGLIPKLRPLVMAPLIR
jgi:chorismate dehydratase